MGKLEGRVSALESLVRSWSGACHRIIVGVGDTTDEALDAYGRERIDPNDRVIIRRIVSPKGFTDEAA